MGGTHRIFWNRYQGQTYLYGTILDFAKDRSVTVRVPLMPSGKVLYTWYSVRDFQRDREEPALPLLTEGRRYRITAYLESEPDDSVLLRIRFFNRQDTETGVFLPDGLSDLFTVPRGAFSYALELVKKGCETVRFHYVEIAEADDDI